MQRIVLTEQQHFTISVNMKLLLAFRRVECPHSPTLNLLINEFVNAKKSIPIL
jgi:hypothetical protein